MDRSFTMDELITGMGEIKATVSGGRWDICQTVDNIQIGRAHV